MTSHGWITTTLILLPLIAGARVLDGADAAGLGRARRAARLAVRGRLLDRGARPLRLRPRRAPGVEPRHVARGPRRLVLGRLLPGLLDLAGRPDDRGHVRFDRLRRLDGARPAARLLRPDAVPDRRDRRRLHGPGPAPLLRVLGGDADPAVRPDRRVGRARPAERDDQVRYLHDGRLAADAGRGDRLRPPGRDVLDDHRRDERERLDLPRLRRRVRRQGAALPVPRLAAGRLPRVASGGLGRAVGRDLEGGRVRLPAHLLLALPGGRARLPHADPRAGGDRADLRLAARVPRA